MIANMTKFCVFIALLMISVVASAQSFEGKVKFKNTFKSKMEQVPDQQLASMFGVNSEYMIKGGNYKNVTDGLVLQWQLYVNDDNKLYIKTAINDVILYNDCSENPDEVLKVEVNRNATRILGHSCDELVLTCKSGVQRYYYSPGVVKVDASAFAKHKFGNLNEVMARTNSLPLKMIVVNAQFTIETVAVEISPEKLDDEIFTLPAGATVTKNPHKL